MDDCLLKTSVFAEELPKNDTFFYLNKLKVHVSYRKHLSTFLKLASNHFELIAWTAAQEAYTASLANAIERSHGFKFAHILSLSDQSMAEGPGKSLYVKNIEVLTVNRSEKDIIFVDTSLANFANRLANGVWLPPYQVHQA